MKTEIAVCYADTTVEEGFVVIRVPWADRATLPLTGVLHIALIMDGQDQRYQSSSYHDYYQLVWNTQETECCLTGHDGDYGFFSLEDYKQKPDWRFPFILPRTCIEFEGVYVDDDVWEASKLIYGNSAGRMF